MERKPVTQQKLEIQSLIDQLGSALESYYDDSEREVEYFGGIFSENEEDAVGMIRRGYAKLEAAWICLLYTSPSPRDKHRSRMPSSA